jgi:aminoglycoside 6-adenylyltransferase
MRNEEEMFRLILEAARNDERIRAVHLNGSRANPNARKDIFQDYDVVYFVTDLESLTADPGWVEIFGERIIMQMPDRMRLPGYPENSRDSFAFLMLFTDGNRIDLTLFPLDKLRDTFVPDSLTLVLLDKDGLFPQLPAPNESDYLTKPPTEQEFLDVCNEFWWVAPYVAKGLRRDQITYAKAMLEGPIRQMLMQIVEWHTGIKTDFSVNFGSNGKNLKKLVEAEFYERLMMTYPDANPRNIWQSLFLMTEMFFKLSDEIAAHFGFDYPHNESLKVIDYLHDVESVSSGS